MDFLEIRRKAKERAAAGEAGRGDPSAPRDPGPTSPDAGAAPAERPARARAPVGDDAAVLRDAGVAAGKVSTELQAIVGGTEPPEGDVDPRFTTWRPGSDARPLFADPEPPPAPVEPPARSPSPPGVGPAAEKRPIPVAAAASPSAVAPPASPERPAAEKTDRARGPAPERRSPARTTNPLDEFFYREDEELPGLLALPGEGETAEEPGPEDSAIEEYLTFQLGIEEYAVAIERVREVLKSQPVTEVPRAPTGILGVVTVRGEVVAVFDPRHRLGLPGPTPPEGSGRIVIVDDGEGSCGLLVDAVASVVRLARGSIEPCPQGIGGASGDCLAGIGRERNRLFTVLDLGALLRRAPGGARGGRATHAGA
jgi:purine-binding chemotaxis protein CheW